jgi:DNA-binding MarR family transcriptional regulator
MSAVTAIQTDLGRLLLEGHRLLATEMVSWLDERGYPDFRAGYAAVFLHIDRRSGTRLTELARRARITKQGMMLIVDDLESRGYVRRLDDERDARAKVVRLTARGRRCAAEARRAAAAIEGRARRLLGPRRYEAMRESLEDLVDSDEGLEG